MSTEYTTIRSDENANLFIITVSKRIVLEEFTLNYSHHDAQWEKGILIYDYIIIRF